MLTGVVVNKTSPPTSPVPGGSPHNQDGRYTAQAKRQKYFRRLFKFKQMDFEFALWQMIYLMSAPQKVYRNFQYRKHTKNQWARDDPAFLVLLSLWLCGSSVGFALVLGLTFMEFFKFLMWTVFVDCIGAGLLVATFLWYISNKYLQATPNRPQDVEWGYAFDVHLNAFFPVLILLHVVQLCLYLPMLKSHLIHAVFFSNTLWLIACGYYVYITFLGYSALPFLKRTILLLYPPCLVLILLYILTLLTRINLTMTVMNFYWHRVSGD